MFHGLRQRPVMQIGMENVVINLRRIVRWATACLSLFISFALHAQVDYPNRPIRLIVPWPAGGVTDALARVLAEEMRKQLAQPVVVENKGGGAGITGSLSVSMARSDGYTLLFVSNTHTINVASRPKLPFDTQADFQPLMLLASSPMMLVVNSSSEIKSLKNYVHGAVRAPESVSFGAANGTSAHFAGEQFASIARIKTTAVPYGVTSQVATAVLAGEVSSAWMTVNTALPLITAGKLRALGIASKQRSSLAPEVLTFGEQGFSGMINESWFGVLGPSKMPPVVVSRLDGALTRLIAQPDIRMKLTEFGFSPVGLRLGDFAERISSEIQEFSVIARERGINLN